VARKKQKRVAVLDLETDPFKYGRVPVPFASGYFDGEHYQHFWGADCVADLVEYIQDETDLIIYAHNGGKFDFYYFLPYLDKDLFIINGRIAKATMFDGAIELRDSWLILPLPLSTHGKLDIDYNKMEAEVRGQHKPEILRYLQKDCRSLWDWVTKFRNDFGGGLTLAGAAFKQLKKTGYEVQNSYDDYDSLFRQFYFGGRVQCFQTGSFYGRHEYVDINSAYSFAMMHQHPKGTDYVEMLKLPNDDKPGCYFADIEAVSKGALPFKHENKLYFPDDDTPRRYFVTGWEVRAGLETDTLKIIKVHRVYRPLFTSDFSEYVNRFFKLKSDADKAGDQTLRTFAKLFLNACYGKFGQDGRGFEKFTLCDYGEWPEGEDWTLYAQAETGQTIFSRPDPVDRFYNVATAASVTGFVRAYLWRAIQDSDAPLYCDTDSIICKSYEGNRGDKLGQWDLEAVAFEVHIAQRKMYGMRTYKPEWPFTSTKVASKGVRLNFDQIKEGVENGRNINTERDAPAFSLKYGPRFFARKTNFENIAKNSLTVPAEAG